MAARIRYPVCGRLESLVVAWLRLAGPVQDTSICSRFGLEVYHLSMDILDLIFPKRCINCGRWGRYVCEKCEVGLWEEEQICPRCCRRSRYGLRHKYCKRVMEGLTCF